MALKNLETSGFDAAIESGISVIDFWAPWCGPCKMLTPTMEALADEMQDINFYKVNIDDNPEIATKFSIMSIPTILIFKDGKKVEEHIGLLPKDHLAEKINNVK